MRYLTCKLDDKANNLHVFHGKASHGYTMLFTPRGRKYILIAVLTSLLLLFLFLSKDSLVSLPTSQCVNCPQVYNSRISPTETSVNNQANETVDVDYIKHRKDWDWDRVFYNRVPKCGSRGVLEVIRKLSKDLHYRYKESNVYSPHYLVNQSEESFVTEFRQYKTPFLYDRHLHFVDFTKFGFKQPVYINVIRDPFERVVSGFYFLKNSAKKHGRPYPPQRYNMTFEECVKLHHSDCFGERYTWKEIPFFCGHNPLCRKPSEAALQLAKKNIEKYYLVVGTTENLNQAFEVLEALLPRFFAGSAKIFRKMENKLHKRYKGKIRRKTNQESKDAMMKALDLDYRLYQWVQHRFNRLYKSMEDKKYGQQ